MPASSHRRRHGIAEKTTRTRRGQSPRQPEALPRRISVGGDKARGLQKFAAGANSNFSFRTPIPPTPCPPSTYPQFNACNKFRPKTSKRTCLGQLLDTCEAIVGTVLGHFWNMVGKVSGHFRYIDGIFVVQTWVSFETMLDVCWSIFGIVSIHFWEMLGSVWGQFLNRFESPWEDVRDIVRIVLGQC